MLLSSHSDLEDVTGSLTPSVPPQVLIPPLCRRVFDAPHAWEPHSPRCPSFDDHTPCIAPYLLPRWPLGLDHLETGGVFSSYLQFPRGMATSFRRRVQPMSLLAPWFPSHTKGGPGMIRYASPGQLGQARVRPHVLAPRTPTLVGGQWLSRGRRTGPLLAKDRLGRW